MLVSLADAASQLGVILTEEELDLTPEDAADDPLEYPEVAEIYRLMRLSQAAVISYLKAPEHEWAAETVPEEVRAAILLVLRSMKFDPFDQHKVMSGLGSGDPTTPAVALLYRLRDPALA